MATISLSEKPAWFERRWNKVRRLVLSPQFFLSIIILLVLAYLILVPIVNLMWVTVSWGEGDQRLAAEAVPGQFTLAHWQRMVFGSTADKFLYEPFLHSLAVGGTAAVAAILLGSLLAWLVTRTDLPGRSWLRTLLVVPFMLPSFAIALAWTTMFNSNAVGRPSGFLEGQLGITPPEWMSYGPIPIVLTMIIHYFPFAFLVAAGALSTVDAQMEEGAIIAGASRWKVLSTITLPMVAPALFSAFVLTFGKTVGTFALPAVLGTPEGYYTLSTMLFSNIKVGLESNAYVIAIIAILFTSLTLLINARFMGATARFVTIGGKGFKPNPTKLGKWRWVFFVMVIAFVSITVLLPLTMLALQTVMAVNGVYSLDNFTWHFWFGQSDPNYANGEPGVFISKGILESIWNTLRLAVSGAFLGSILGTLIGYLITRNKSPLLARLLDQITYLPYLVPSIAFGAMYLSLFAVERGPVPALYGTFTLLVLVSVVKNLPYTTRTGASAITQIGKELEEAAEVQGASWFERFWRVILPLGSSGIVAGMIITFITIMRELSLIIILVTPTLQVLMTRSYRYQNDNAIQMSNALALVVILLTVIGEAITWKLGKGKLAKARSIV